MVAGYCLICNSVRTLVTNEEKCELSCQNDFRTKKKKNKRDFRIDILAMLCRYDAAAMIL